MDQSNVKSEPNGGDVPFGLTQEAVNQFAKVTASLLQHIPTEAMARLHARFELGIKSYGEKSWNANSNQSALTDIKFIRDRIAHAHAHLRHLLEELNEGIRSGEFKFTDDDPAAIMWFGVFMACAQTALKELTNKEQQCSTLK